MVQTAWVSFEVFYWLLSIPMLAYVSTDIMQSGGGGALQRVHLVLHARSPSLACLMMLVAVAQEQDSSELGPVTI